MPLWSMPWAVAPRPSPVPLVYGALRTESPCTVYIYIYLRQTISNVLGIFQYELQIMITITTYFVLNVHVT